jgi:hypothetical protein
MPNIPGSVPVTGFIAPTDAGDTYATFEPIYGRDGLRSLADKATRNAITTDRRRQGMLVVTQDTMETWQLLAAPWVGTDADWALYTPGGSLPTPTTVPLVDAVATVAASLAVDAYASVWWEITIYKASTGAREQFTVAAWHNGNVAGDATVPVWTSYGVGPNTAGHVKVVDLNGVGIAQVMRLMITANGTGWAVNVTTRTHVAGAV